MRPPARDWRIVWFAIGAWLAAAIGDLAAPRTCWGVALLATAIVAATSRRHPAVALGGIGVALGTVSAGLHAHALRTGPVPYFAARGAAVTVIARVVRDPVPVAQDPGLTLIDATVSRVAPLAGQGRGESADAPVLVMSYGAGWGGMLPGQWVRLVGVLHPPRTGDDVAAVLSARAPPIQLGRPPWWQRAAGQVRSALRAATSKLPPDERGLLPSLVDGDTSRAPPSLQAAMRATGLTHLEAVSGENVSIVLAVALAGARGLGLRRRWRVVASGLALLGFVVLARPTPSVLRAAVMGAVVLAGMWLGRRASPLPAVSAAVAGLVLVQPSLARSIGFVLSVVATAALVTVAPVWARRLSRHMPRPLALAVAVAAAAQLACTPVLIAAFGTLTPYAVPANLLAAPAVPPATVLGVAAAVAATVCPPLGVGLGWLAAAPTAVIAHVARLLAALPGANARWSATTAVLCGIVAVLAVGVMLWRRGLPCREAGVGRDILGRWPQT
ncbi:MAG TPA: ComEC/Rec2 family competence protein [Mycobacteriales bacterium]|nr:ComEC/Rec2 family competence protein [Mycobacteriales bacterium]